MFSSEERCILKNNQLAEVICQFLFPDILIINTQLPSQFQDVIRSEFPLFSSRKEIPATQAVDSVHASPIINYQFASADNNWRINLTCNFISLSCRKYTCWEDFANKLDKPLAAFIQIYQPAYFSRIGLRYLNFISRKKLALAHIPYSELIQPAYLGLMGLDNMNETAMSRSTVDAEMTIQGGCRLKIHAGPGKVSSNGIAQEEVHFILDQDLFTGGNIPIHSSTSTLHTLHRQAYPIFRSAIHDTLFDAMDPAPI